MTEQHTGCLPPTRDHEATPLRQPVAPRRAGLLLEARAPFEAAAALPKLATAALFPRVARAPHAVMVVPGFGVGDDVTRPLRYYLRKQGHETRGWGLGRNLAGVDIRHELSDLSDRWDFEQRENYRGEASVPLLSDRLADEVLDWHRAVGRPVTL
ncbi:MAG: hypothetical protein AAFX85_05445, partial [Pseudomonadota bacterium]